MFKLFSKSRFFSFFKIKRTDLNLLFPLVFLYGLICFNYHILHSIREIFFISTTGSAEILPFIKTYLVSPVLFILVFLYVKSSKYLSATAKFNVVLLYFALIFFSCWKIFIPNKEFYAMDKFYVFFSSRWPALNYLWQTIRLWPLSLLYTHAEAWTAIVLSIGFWSFANDVFTFESSQRLYSYISAFGSFLGCVIAGIVLKSQYIYNNFTNTIGLVLLTILLIFICYNFLVNRLLKYSDVKDNAIDIIKEKKSGVSIYQSIKVLLSSRHLLYIATLVFCFGFFLNLFEVVLQDSVAEYSRIHGVKAMYGIYGSRSFFIGVLVLFFGVFSTFTKNSEWKYGALITPVIALIATMAFFILMILASSKTLSVIISKYFSPLTFSVYIGLATIIIINASKYVFFDSTKEQSYIVLDSEIRIKGKAVIDGLIAKTGKASGAAILSLPKIGLISLMGSIQNSREILYSFFLIALFFWLRAIYKLNHSINRRTI